MPKYAQIDGGRRCVAVTDAAAPIDAPSMVPVPSAADSALLGATLDEDGETWTDGEGHPISL